ncbi:MAG TPA: organomercurial lyase [Acidimicrobiales bacterium]|jgi:hypothetical protein|nr:organomercurial lyase [Acidimicrobiales bacterium]
MAQYVPGFTFTDESLQLRKFIFDFWADTGRAPNLRQMHEGTQLDRRAIVQALKLLQTGIVVVVDQDSPNCDILKAPPFSAFPSQVEMYIDDEFHSYIGCAHEAVAVSNMPHFAGKEVRLESYCACCLQPITLWSTSFELSRSEPPHPLVHIAVPMWDWVHDDMKYMCDNTNLVIDRDHAARYEQMIGRRGVFMTLDQVRQYVEPAVGIRGWDYHWPPQSMNPEAIIVRMRGLGVDLSPWGL